MTDLSNILAEKPETIPEMHSPALFHPAVEVGFLAYFLLAATMILSA
jgi:hypothetical protein